MSGDKGYETYCDIKNSHNGYFKGSCEPNEFPLKNGLKVNHKAQALRLKYASIGKLQLIVVLSLCECAKVERCTNFSIRLCG